jgi:SAM-dependent methyltransferase
VSDMVAAAYDAIASTYDDAVAGDEWVRRRLWEHYLRAFQPGFAILDVSCGTGIDAIFLADHQMKVTGIDLSDGMLAQARRKVAVRGLASSIDLRILDVRHLVTLPAASFDGAVSAFGGLNTVPDLATFASDLARVLRPRGHFVAHIVNRFSVWECLGYLGHGKLAQAWALPGRQARTFEIGGQSIAHSTYGPRETYERFFAPHFRLRRLCGQGILRPPHTVRRIPAGAVEALGRIERTVESLPFFRGCGRFFLIDLERR